MNDRLSLKEEKYRVIFEFSQAKDVQPFLDAISKAFDDRTLQLSGIWAWSAEVVQQAAIEGESDNG
jgi:hypothetical protein